MQLFERDDAAWIGAVPLDDAALIHREHALRITGKLLMPRPLGATGPAGIAAGLQAVLFTVLQRTPGAEKGIVTNGLHRLLGGEGRVQ